MTECFLFDNEPLITRQKPPLRQFTTMYIISSLSTQFPDDLTRWSTHLWIMINFHMWARGGGRFKETLSPLTIFKVDDHYQINTSATIKSSKKCLEAAKIAKVSDYFKFQKFTFIPTICLKWIEWIGFCTYCKSYNRSRPLLAAALK